MRGCLLLLLAGCAGPRTDPREALLELHDAQRRAHLAEDAEGMADLLADGFVEVRDGQRLVVARADTIARFRRYFDAVEFLAWEDLAPPAIELARDGSLATMAVEKLVRCRVRDENGAPHVERTLFAWLATCAPGPDGRWRIVQIASTRRPHGPETTLAAARHAIGGDARLSRLARAHAVVRGSGPSGTYHLELDLPRTGPWRLCWRFPGRAPRTVELDGAQGWSVALDGTRTPLDPAEAQVVRLHAFPWLVPRFEELFPSRTLAPDVGDGLEVLDLVDPLGQPARAVFRREEEDRLSRLEVLDATREPPSPVTLEFGAWQEVEGVLVPRLVVATDASGEWRLELTDLILSLDA